MGAHVLFPSIYLELQLIRDFSRVIRERHTILFTMAAFSCLFVHYHLLYIHVKWNITRNGAESWIFK